MPAPSSSALNEFLPSKKGKDAANRVAVSLDPSRGQIDNIAEASAPLRHLEQVIENDGQQDVVDATSFVVGQKTGRTPTAPLVASSSAQPTKAHLSVLTKCWSTIDTLDIPAIKHGIKSWYTPCSISLFEVLSEMDNIFNGNEELRWYCPSYFSLPTRVYYSVLFYVQVLRAKEHSGALTHSEGSFLRAFFRRFKDTMCPVAGPLIPIFTNIVSVVPDDVQYEYVYPHIPRHGTYRTTVSGTTSSPEFKTVVDSTHYLLPSVPLLASILRYFCNSPALPAENFNDMGYYVPFKISAGFEKPFAGVLFPKHASAEKNSLTAQLLSNPALAHPLCESKVRLREIHEYWKRSPARYTPDITLNRSYDPSSIAEQVLMYEEFDWFEPCIHMAQVQAHFFSDSENLSSIPVLGHSATLAMAQLSFPHSPTIPDEMNEWFPDLFSRVYGTFSATCGLLTLEQKQQAMYAITTAELQWTNEQGKPIGSLDANGKSGPYFENQKVTYASSAPEKMIRNIYSMLQKHFYHARGV